MTDIEAKKREVYIRAVCRRFVKDLGTHITDRFVFDELEAAASLAGYQISAEQHGIRGVRLTFIPKEPGIVS